MEILVDHSSKLKALIGNGFAANTLKGYRTTVKHLTAFLQLQYKVTDIDIKRVNHEFVTAYEFYIRASVGCSAVSAAKYIKHFRKITNLCLANSWITVNLFAHYKFTAKAKEREFLTKAELESFANKKFSISRLKAPRSRIEIFEHIGISNQPKNYRLHILKLINAGYIKLTEPDKQAVNIKNIILQVLPIPILILN